MATSEQEEFIKRSSEILNDLVRVAAEATSSATSLARAMCKSTLGGATDSPNKQAPLLKDLCQVAIPRYAAHWKMLGTLLGVQNWDLDILERDKHYQTVECCRSMLAIWLDTDSDATWDKFYEVIKLPAFKASIIYSEQTVNKPLQDISLNPIQMDRESLDDNKCYCGKPTFLDKVKDINSKSTFGKEFYRCSSKRCVYRNVVWCAKSKKIFVVCHCQLEAVRTTSTNNKGKPCYICPEERCRFLIWESEIGSEYTVTYTQRKLTDYRFTFQKRRFKEKRKAEGHCEKENACS